MAAYPRGSLQVLLCGGTCNSVRLIDMIHQSMQPFSGRDLTTMVIPKPKGIRPILFLAAKALATSGSGTHIALSAFPPRKHPPKLANSCTTIFPIQLLCCISQRKMFAIY